MNNDAHAILPALDWSDKSTNDLITAMLTFLPLLRWLELNADSRNGLFLSTFSRRRQSPPRRRPQNQQGRQVRPRGAAAGVDQCALRRRGPTRAPFHAGRRGRSASEFAAASEAGSGQRGRGRRGRRGRGRCQLGWQPAPEKRKHGGR